MNPASTWEVNDPDVQIVPTHTIDRTGGKTRFVYYIAGVGTLEVTETDDAVAWRLGPYGHRRAK